MSTTMSGELQQRYNLRGRYARACAKCFHANDSQHKISKCKKPTPTSTQKESSDMYQLRKRTRSRNRSADNKHSKQSTPSTNKSDVFTNTEIEPNLPTDAFADICPTCTCLIINKPKYDAHVHDCGLKNQSQKQQENQPVDTPKPADSSSTVKTTYDVSSIPLKKRPVPNIVQPISSNTQPSVDVPTDCAHPSADSTASVSSVPKSNDIFNNSFPAAKKPINQEQSIAANKNIFRQQSFRYKCLACRQDFDSRDAVIQHANEHHERPDYHKFYPCPHCNIHYFDQNQLNMHLNLSHGQSFVFKCVFCAITFDQVDELIEHHNVHVRNLTVHNNHTLMLPNHPASSSNVQAKYTGTETLQLMNNLAMPLTNHLNSFRSFNFPIASQTQTNFSTTSQINGPPVGTMKMLFRNQTIL